MAIVQRTSLFGIPVDLLTIAETVALIEESMRSRRRLQHVALNVAKLVKVQADTELRNDVVESDIVGADGAGILLGARLMGVRIPERVAGVDLMMEVLALCEREEFRPYFLGATEEVVEGAVAASRERWPGLSVAGRHHGYFGAAGEHEVVESIRRSGADCLFVAMPSPLKERFCHAYRDSLGVSFIMGVGGSFDILAGKTRRAPRLVQNWGLEWAYRVLQEPRRMWRRYLTTNSRFLWMLLKAALSGRREHVFSRAILDRPQS